MYDIQESVLQAALVRQEVAIAELLAAGDLSPHLAADARARISTTTDAATAAVNADLLTESVREHLKSKREVFSQFGGLCPPRTLFTTNTSFFLPSEMAEATERGDRFAALHFHTHVWFSNVADIMPHAGTSPDTTQLLFACAHAIRQNPVVYQREHRGFVVNSLITPMFIAAMAVMDSDVMDSLLGCVPARTLPFATILILGQECPRMSAILRLAAHQRKSSP
jgi:3-hydroxybutyryl-CoA dehydrogenase